jgi:hypothetical protein
MIAELATELEGFHGTVSWTRCFAHIINLVSKRILLLFNNDTKESIEKAEKSLQKLADPNVDLDEIKLDDMTEVYEPGR